jgi:hypothetical protein
VEKNFSGAGTGILAGALLGETASVFKPLGDIFINAIMMLIVPLVFSTLVVGITSMRDPQKMGRIGARTITLYLVTTAFAISIGLLLSTLLQPGVGVDLSFDTEVTANEAPSLISILVNLVAAQPSRCSGEWQHYADHCICYWLRYFGDCSPSLDAYGDTEGASHFLGSNFRGRLTQASMGRDGQPFRL